MYLTELQHDALREVFNVGVGYAAGSLNELLGTPISLRVPDVDVLALDEARLRVIAFGWGRVASVQLSFWGPLEGNVALVFPYDNAVKLVSLLTGDEGCNSDVDGIRAATLEETGNIILNGVVGSISNLLQGQISFSIPYYSEQGGLPARFAGAEASAGLQVIFARARFGVAEHEIEGEIFLFLEIGSLETLVAALDCFIESPTCPS
jgi:chemotaxis protein CheC